MRRRILPLLLAALALAPSVRAQEVFHPRWTPCVFEVPADGFVALRAAPSRDAPLVARMDPVDGWFMAQTRDHVATRQGRWIYVLYVPPGMEADEAERRNVVGWMHDSLNAGCDA